LKEEIPAAGNCGMGCDAVERDVACQTNDFEQQE
jgi:hypothetical protein